MHANLLANKTIAPIRTASCTPSNRQLIHLMTTQQTMMSNKISIHQATTRIKITSIKQ